MQEIIPRIERCSGHVILFDAGTFTGRSLRGYHVETMRCDNYPFSYYARKCRRPRGFYDEMIIETAINDYERAVGKVKRLGQLTK